MPQFPNYSPMNNNPYMTAPNPYMDRMNFLQGYQQSLQQPMAAGVQMSQPAQQMNVIGKIVDGIESVRAMDIPMDGNIYYFPKADGSEIYGKHWIVNEGRTRILTFKPFFDSDPNNVSTNEEKLKIDAIQSVTEAFNERFDRLENQISELISKSVTKTSVSKAKKENVDNE